MKNKMLIMTIVMPLLIILILALAVVAIFNGIIEIVQEVLGNIVGFLSDPLGYISQVAQDAWNTLATLNPLDNGR